ncbi:PD-(D/E)XK nuclease-like domain-containing protein [Rhodococcus sp. IEGM 1366]|uniref:PD-(D/E)XK nuclease-like domain-containing protein n=1 Tax=Rhodococcus sp. IEGM 1366 TaxID=3082223 RepID=UPI002953BFCE|nr:PD-(D/E)XK nuclease-like domain-containing protein [Rhodococcus sp. IEGM 1366]MDV8066413.1 PD-(D/E)XK nuclease-like domain-containing protein [Rhodococcus sp. IEGM 1366]
MTNKAELEPIDAEIVDAEIVDEPLLAPDEEGVYEGIPDHVYHGDTNSLSSSGARKILSTNPAKFRYGQLNNRKPTKAFDLGHAAHTLVLGEGPELREIPEKVLASNGAVSTKEAKTFIAEARAAGAVPLKPDEYKQVHEMADQLRAHPLASLLFTSGAAELSLYHRDRETGVMIRTRPDWLPDRKSGRLLITDYKTAVDAGPKAFRKSMFDYGYFQQHPWYVDAVAELGIDDDPAFLFVVQEKTAPYQVVIHEIDAEDVELGRQLNRQAIDLFAQCQQSGHWPGPPAQVHRASLSGWARNEIEETLQ